jgi:nucleoside-triphosphatase
MKRHIFLTGEVQVGKSTLIKKTLAAFPGLRPAGFYTLSAPLRPDGSRPVYLWPASGEPIFTEDHLVGVRLGEGRGIESYPAVFDEAGVKALSDAENAQLVVMDELWRMEKDAALFTARVLELAAGKTPILGVLQKKADTPMARAIRENPEAELWTVTAENRDGLAEKLYFRLRETLGRRTDSGGAIVVRPGPEVLLIRMGKTRVSFPKGHLEPGERPEDAALRETLEETGITARLCGPGIPAPSAKEGDERTVWFFPAEYVKGEPRPQPGETTGAFWAPPGEASALLSFAPDREALQKAIQMMNEK